MFKCAPCPNTVDMCAGKIWQHKASATGTLFHACLHVSDVYVDMLFSCPCVQACAYSNASGVIYAMCMAKLCKRCNGFYGLPCLITCSCAYR